MIGIRTWVSKVPNPPPPWLSSRPITRYLRAFYPNVLAHGITVLEELLGHVGAEYDDLVRLSTCWDLMNIPLARSRFRAVRYSGVTPTT